MWLDTITVEARWPVVAAPGQGQTLRGSRFPMCYGPEFTAKAVRGWIAGVGAKTACIEPGSPWENGYVESFNGKLRDEPLDGEVFNTLAEAEVLIERWRQHYNTGRPHSSLGYRPPAPEVVVPSVTPPPSRPGPIGSAQPLAAMLHWISTRTTRWGLVRRTSSSSA